jgi:carboxy-terminal domain RNA polymerase II polypeptide A small phosphatase
MQTLDKSSNIVILDLDETLIHASTTKLGHDEDFKLDDYFVYQRPYLKTFLKSIAGHFKLGIWSSADDEYVKAISDVIMPKDIQLEIVWGASKCTPKRDLSMDQYYWVKRLDKQKSKGFKIEQILIVDDSPEKSKDNFGNAIPIKKFTGELFDNELPILYKYLLTLKHVPNVRRLEKRFWKHGLTDESVSDW